VPTATAKQAMAAFTTRLPDLAVIDISLEEEPEGGSSCAGNCGRCHRSCRLFFSPHATASSMPCRDCGWGADDFLTKDLSLAHLIARVNALFRRVDACAKPHETSQVIRRGPLSSDGERMQGRVGRPGRAVVSDGFLDRTRVGAYRGT